MKKNKRKTVLIVLLFIAIVVIAGIFIIKNLIDKLEVSLEELKDMEIENVDISKIPNGIYKGQYAQFPIDVVLSVTVDNGQITDIQIQKHVNGKGKDAEKITDKVISQKNLQVDTITGATYSSIVILKAIEQALKNR
ncbi:MAG TPA: FMN-binding protein [Thermotogota bacterium]|nr:FMN-binding protein [Thermotogota bacterium]HRW34735.1 FMN-binding protein [Thermotogota bacterium]